MSWTIFHFNCRYLANKLEQGYSKDKAVMALNDFDTKPLFGDQTLNAGAKLLFEDILTISNDGKFLDCLKSYNTIDINEVGVDRKTIKKQTSSLNYMVVLFFIYILIASLFSVYVFPTFTDIFDMFQSELPAQFLAFENVFIISNIVLVTLLVFQYCLLKQLKTLYKKMTIIPSLAWILPKSVKTSFTNMHQILKAPILLANGQSDSPMMTSIVELQKQGMTLDKEFSGLVLERKVSLERSITTSFAASFGLIQMFLYLAIGFLISVMYLPIFSLGHII